MLWVFHSSEKAYGDQILTIFDKIGLKSLFPTSMGVGTKQNGLKCHKNSQKRDFQG